VNAVNKRLRETAEETVAIVRQGGYRVASGAWVDITDAVANAVAGTRLYLPDEPLPVAGPANPAPVVEVTTESTLAAARRLGDGTAALVFASARNPGGGFRTGARAQEEDGPAPSPLCCPAGRYACCRSPQRTGTAGWSSAPGAAACSATTPRPSPRRSPPHCGGSISSTTSCSPCSIGRPEHPPTTHSRTASGPGPAERRTETAVIGRSGRHPQPDRLD